MFLRLHVNDTDKGGPRAPPRNKMALYEQLSILSQRYNPGVLPLNRANKTSSLVLPASSSQDIVRILNLYLCFLVHGFWWCVTY
jgi:EARLY FLOWERING 3 protein